MKNDKKLSVWEKYLTREIGIEFKACLYFFAILFFYCIYRMFCGEFSASILHMAEMILACYLIGYAQVYLLWNFDEAEKLGKREWFGMVLCTALYGTAAHFCKWFDGQILMSAVLSGYILITYICVFFIYKSKRKIDDKKLNEELRLFQTRHKK